MTEPLREPRREPIINLPAVITAAIAAFAAVHLLRVFALDPMADLEVLARFAFVPDRAAFAAQLAPIPVPDDLSATILSLFSYAFLHGDAAHLILNCVWLAAFGAPVALRLGAWRTLAVLAVGSVAGALAHYALSPDDTTPLIGASASVSAAMGVAGRFIFLPGGGMLIGPRVALARIVPAMPLRMTLADRRVVLFVAVWIGINLVVALGLLPIAGLDQEVAWEAHIAGFLAGFLLFPVLDRVPLPVALPLNRSHDASERRTSDAGAERPEQEQDRED
ncbi:MAG: rhomboid family intramembrane serine protease [Hyphomicrobiaceae bacterium]|nr:rhomboid family intramembrane serine protease [Hyphomicrobiaceae bacterium]